MFTIFTDTDTDLTLKEAKTTLKQLGLEIVLNVELDENKLYPKSGVYSGYLIVDNNKYLSMINIGKHPTVKELNKEIVEVHVINQTLDLYDKDITLIFDDFIREEKKFDSLEKLIEQLNKDKENILNKE